MAHSKKNVHVLTQKWPQNLRTEHFWQNRGLETRVLSKNLKKWPHFCRISASMASILQNGWGRNRQILQIMGFECVKKNLGLRVHPPFSLFLLGFWGVFLRDQSNTDRSNKHRNQTQTNKASSNKQRELNHTQIAETNKAGSNKQSKLK